MRLLPAILLALALAVLGTLPAGADSADDSEDSFVWVSPTPPSGTPCNFTMTLIGDWSPQDEDDRVRVVNTTWLTGSISDKTQSNAALRGEQIAGYSWSWDSPWYLVAGDSAGSYDIAGLHTCAIRYGVLPAKGCRATYEVWYNANWSWEIAPGTGHADLEVKGLMRAQLLDQPFKDPDAAGGVLKVSGDRASGYQSGTGSVSIGGVTVPFDIAPNASTDISPDGGIIAVEGEHKPPITFTGDTLDVTSYAKVRTYVDEPGLWDSGWAECGIGGSNPAFMVRFVCAGAVQCAAVTESRYEK